MRKLSRAALLLAGLLALAGCRVEVYDKLSQRDANEMTALLLIAGIDAERVTHKDGTFAVSVGEEDFAEAVTLIDQSGLPKPKFASMTDVLSDDRLIASPSEERARLNYALAQELSRTVSDIEGVVIARVHLATPNDDPLSRRDAQDPTASVAIHHRSDLATGGVVPRIKMLVANAVDGLEYDRVSIALFATSEAKPDDFARSAGRSNTRTAQNDQPASWSNRLDLKIDEFEDPTPTRPTITTSAKRAQAVTPASIGDFNITPALAAILGGGFVVLLLAGHALLTGSRKKPQFEDGASPRRRARR